MDAKNASELTPEVPWICSASSVKESIVYGYRRSFHGFAAKLIDDEAARISGETIAHVND